MEFRFKTKAGKTVVPVLLCAVGASAQPFIYQVQHAHLSGGCSGELEITESGISYEEQGKHKEHSRQWKYSDIQQLKVSPDRFTILTYEDEKWELGRDRRYQFDHLPKDFVKQVYPFFRKKLDQRFVSKLADSDVKPLWQTPAKLMTGWKGAQGTLIVGGDRIVFRADRNVGSQTWRYGDIENISSSGPFEFSITTLEHAGIWNSNWQEFRFQMKQPLSEETYNDLWLRLNRKTILEPVSTPLPDHHKSQ